VAISLGREISHTKSYCADPLKKGRLQNFSLINSLLWLEVPEDMSMAVHDQSVALDWRPAPGPTGQRSWLAGLDLARRARLGGAAVIGPS
jgi:hypothetical protein